MKAEIGEREAAEITYIGRKRRVQVQRGISIVAPARLVCAKGVDAAAIRATK